MPTIKRKVEMNLPQLIEWLWKSKKSVYKVTSNMNGVVKLEPYGLITFSSGDFYPEETFTVEVDEPITENTVFELMIEIIDGYQNCLWERASVEDWKDEDSKEFHAYIDGKFELIWKNGKMV